MQRARSDIFPRPPQNLAQLSQILEDPQFRYISSTSDMTDSIYLGTAVGLDGSCNIVFISSRCLNLLSTTETVFGDGTFYITPSVDDCYQVNTRWISLKHYLLCKVLSYMFSFFFRSLHWSPFMTTQ